MPAIPIFWEGPRPFFNRLFLVPAWGADTCWLGWRSSQPPPPPPLPPSLILLPPHIPSISQLPKPPTAFTQMSTVYLPKIKHITLLAKILENEKLTIKMKIKSNYPAPIDPISQKFAKTSDDIPLKYICNVWITRKELFRRKTTKN